MNLILNVNNTRFSLNGIEYFKNYISNVAGSQIKIINAYDSCDVLLDWVHFNQISVNEVVYGSVALLQHNIIDVMYNRAVGVDTSNFLTKPLKYDLTTNNAVTGTYVIDYLFDTFNLVLTGNTTFSESNLPTVGFTKTITMYVSGNYAITYPAGWTTFIIGSYDGSKLNQFVIEYRSTGVYFIIINQPD